MKEVLINGETYLVKDWGGEYLGPEIVIDTETTVVPFYLTADLCVFGTKKIDSNDIYLVPLSKVARFINKHRECHQVYHNAPFDQDVISKHIDNDSWVYDALDNDKVWDTSILYRLWHLAVAGYVPGKYSLAYCAEQILKISVEKGEERVTFEQYRGKPVNDISDEHLTYLAKDLVITEKLYLSMKQSIAMVDEYKTWLSHHIQAKGALALLHIYKNGLNFDLKQRDEWLVQKDKEIQAHVDVLASWGWVRGTKGIKERFENILKFIGIAEELPVTKDGSISSASEDLLPYRTHPFINSFLGFMELEKATNFVRGIETSKVHPRYNLLVNTGRTSCSSPNFQQLPKIGGIREMFKAGSGNVFGIVDYSAIELVTLSQVLLKKYGESEMANRINAGEDLHKYYASVMHRCTVDKVTKDMRQQAKAANFGFPGGLGPATFVEFATGYGLDLTIDQARHMKDTWYKAFPEVRDYMRDEKGEVFTLTGRLRGDTTFCAEKNTPFQGLAADGAKLALYELDKAGLKVVGFVHDEVICEFPEEGSIESLKKQEEIMVKAMRKVVPDVLVNVEGHLSPFYTK